MIKSRKAALEKQRRLAGVVTMNIDYLHQQAGSRRVYEYWGNMRKNHCARCHAGYNWQPAKNEAVPHCRQCGMMVFNIEC